MSMKRKTLESMAALALFVSTAASAADFLPLARNNEWVYRDAKTGQTFQVRVSVPVFVNEQEYHSLVGYTPETLLVRKNANGDLVVYNDEFRREDLLTSFTPFEQGWWNAPHRQCEQEGQTQQRRVDYEGPAGRIGAALQVRYRTFTCADAGIEREEYAENIGMLRRIENTIAGPRQFDLVYARIGKTVLEAQSAGRFAVTVDQRPNEPSMQATLRLETTAMQTLTFPTAQEYEVRLLDAEDNVLWKWSDGRMFGEAFHTRTVEGRWMVTVTIPHPPGIGAEARKYRVQAWLTTAGVEPKFAATAPVMIGSPGK